MTFVRKILPLSLLVLLPAGARPTDDLDRFLQEQIARRQIPGLSIAIIQDGRIIEARGYGVIDQAGSAPVTPQTLFQAGSISKSVAAMGALHLVEAGRLALDSNVNDYLKTWKVPDNKFTSNSRVSLRGLLSHTAGLTVHGFPGYAVDEPKPTLVQVLDGAPPANTEPIRVDTIPGSRWNYSGGGYTIMQQMMLDVTGKTFPDFMRQTVLEPLGMRSSGYEQPPPSARAAATAGGHYEDRSAVKGRWHVYPEMAAAGLWTTPSDLARFAMDVQQTYTGKSHRVISTAMAKQMLTDQRDGDGLGVFLDDTGRALRFRHNGRDEGFDALMVGYAETGQGAVIMINANDDSNMGNRILAFLGRKYHWPRADSGRVNLRPAHQDPTILRSSEGHYEFHNNQIITMVSDDTVLSSLVGGFPDEEFIPLADGGFASPYRDSRFSILKDSSGAIQGLSWREAGSERVVPRIGPLAQASERQSDPDTAFTTKVLATLGALAKGGQAVADAPYLAPGARKDFQGGAWEVFAKTTGLSFLGSENVTGRGIERHQGQVARVVYYAPVPEIKQSLLIYLTADGAITDFDLVDK